MKFLQIGKMSTTAIAFISFSVIGIAVAVYHSYEELTTSFGSFCNINSKVSCVGVFESGHTSLFGVPFYVLGLVWFPVTLVLAILTLERAGTKSMLNGLILLPFLMVGNIFTIYLWYVELGVIGIICPVCVSLYVVNYVMTGLAIKSLL
ncbi:MAG: vitamin K epoxide reductase family protein [archaeon]|nr:vitamin K epoxide reductase family protein [archaeon]